MNKDIAHGDFETRSTVDLPAAGLDTYASHPDTSPWCFSWRLGNNLVEIWVPGDTFPETLRAHIEGGGKFVAHNVSFELAIILLKTRLPSSTTAADVSSHDVSIAKIII